MHAATGGAEAAICTQIPSNGPAPSTPPARAAALPSGPADGAPDAANRAAFSPRAESMAAAWALRVAPAHVSTTEDPARVDGPLLSALAAAPSLD
jgi:hypothetical protein